MRIAILAGALFASIVPSDIVRADATPSGIEIGVRSGYAIPFGAKFGGTSGGDLDKLATGAVPIWFDAGYRVSPNVFVGAFFQYGVGFAASSASLYLALDAPAAQCGQGGVSCSMSDLMFGVDVQYHFLPAARLDPYLGLGIGYEILNFSLSQNGANGSMSLDGGQFLNLQVGADYKAIPNLGIGPFVMFSLGQYSHCSRKDAAGTYCDFSVPPSGGTLPQQALHEWLMLGLRGAFDAHL